MHQTFKGWIGLDIDGTITLDKYSVPQEVIFFFKKLSHQGWRIVFTTGRPFAFAWMALEKFDFPFDLILQNGSLGLKMPERALLFKRYMYEEALSFFETAYEGLRSDFLLYAGYEKGDFCYYRPKRFSVKELAYIEELQHRQTEKWRAVENFNFQEIGPFPLIKCFGDASLMLQVKKRLESSSLFQIAQIRDLHSPGTDVLLVTDQKASKGSGLQELIKTSKKQGRVIVAGDDANDLSLFQVADVRIAMPHAPAELLERADLVAPSTKELGIIKALKQVLS